MKSYSINIPKCNHKKEFLLEYGDGSVYCSGCGSWLSLGSSIKTKAEERLIEAALRFKKQIWNNGDGVCRAAIAVMKERGMTVEVERKKK